VALANAQRSGVNVGLLFVDLDGFKPVNDRFGHSFGDDLLIAIGERLRSSARAGDTVARFGGDEFMVLLPQVEGIGQVEAVARKLLALLAEPFDIHGEEVAMGASAGLSITFADDYDPASLIQRADHAMYRMKSEGRGGFRIWE
jgi:diguanylate cyclase (GGDEF)-like protein